MVTRRTINTDLNIELILAEVPNEILDGDAGVDILQGVVDGQDTFVLGGDGTLPTVGEVVPGSPLSTQTIPGAIILDFNLNEDAVEPVLNAEEIVVSDLQLPVALSYNLFAAGVPLEEAIDSVTALGVRTENVDPDGDGNLEGALITNLADNTPIGYFLNIDDSDLQAALFPAPELPIVTVETDTPNITEGGGAGQFIVNIDRPQNNNTVVNYAIGGTATNGVDYPTIPFSVTIPPGATGALINVNAISDGIFEPLETVNLTLVEADGYSLDEMNNTATININDVTAPPPPTVSINTLTPNITEGGGAGQFIVNIDRPQNNNTVVNYAIGGTATNGVDYPTIPFSVTIPPGATGALINVNAISDGIVEPLETVNLTLQQSNSYNLGAINTATISINNEPPEVTINTFTPNITEEGEQPGQFLFSINSPQNNNTIINYSIDGTATNGLDYVTIGSSVTIPAGITGAVVNINAIADGIPEPLETVNLSLQPSQNNSYTVGGVNTAIVNINGTPAIREINFDNVRDLEEYPIDSLTGIRFDNALGIVNFNQGGSGNFIDSLANLGQGGAITYSEGNSIIMNVPDGFSGLSFRYASPFVNHKVVVYDSLNATGQSLNETILDLTPDQQLTPGAYILTPKEEQINFNGFAQSVSFGSEPNKLIIDDIKLFS